MSAQGDGTSAPDVERDPFEGLSCPECHGSGHLGCEKCVLDGGVRWIACDTCGGDGEYECDDCHCGIPHEVPCASCRGDGGHRCQECVEGLVRCGECEGTGALQRARTSQDPAQLTFEVSP